MIQLLDRTIQNFKTAWKRYVSPYKPHARLLMALRYPIVGLIALSLVGGILAFGLGNLQTNVMYVHSQAQLLFLAAVNLMAVVIAIVIFRRIYDRHMDRSPLNPDGDFDLKPWPQALYVFAMLLALLTPTVALRFSVQQGGLRDYWGTSLHVVLIDSDAKPSGSVHVTPSNTPSTESQQKLPTKASSTRVSGGYMTLWVSLVSMFAGIALGWGILWILEWLTVMSRRYFMRDFVKGYYFPFSQCMSGGRATSKGPTDDDFDRQLLIYLVFLVIFIFSPASLLFEPVACVATLAVLTISVVTMTLSGLGSALSSWRISPLLLFVLWIALVKLVGSSTNEDLVAFKLVTPAQRQDSPNPPANVQPAITDPVESNVTYVVTCPGGGIHAAAWAYLVLNQLSEAEEFKQNLRMVSAVSGGSVGAAFHLAEAYPAQLQADVQTEALSNDEASTNALRLANGGLDEVGKGLLQGDLRSAFFPADIPLFFPRAPGRGQRLEQYLNKQLMRVAFRNHNPQGNERELNLQVWEQRARASQMPVVCFGAMDILSGKRVLLHTGLDLPTGSLAMETKDIIARDHTITVAAALRASAAFPYVSPLVEAGQGEDRFALGDGGYIDNEGIITAVNWIARFKQNLLEVRPGAADSGATHTIYLIRIQPSADLSDQNAGALAADDSQSRRLQFGKSMRWLLGPLQGLVSMRTSSQLERGNLEVQQLVQQAIAQQVNAEQALASNSQDSSGIANPDDKARAKKVVVKVINVPFHCSSEQFEPPLSWVITPNQAKQYSQAWRDLESQSIRQQIGLSQ